MIKLFRYIAFFAILLITGREGFAFEYSHYATNSRLDTGRWAKIEVNETGLQFVSDATLNSLGFLEPEKVNIFGYGGEIIPENLNSPDDLPLVASKRVKGGLVFFGRASVGWERNLKGETVYSHTSHPYSDKSYYFISDCLEEKKQPEIIASVGNNSEVITFFTERLVHEKDITMPMTSGRLMLGEDFKTNTLQTFKFQLPGNTGDAIITTAFACKTSSGFSTLVFSGNGQQLGATTADRMAAADSKLIVTTKTTKNIEKPGEDLELTIKFNGSGNVSTAALDYIEVEYPRLLDVSSGELYFYLSPEKTSEVMIEGADESTIVWDVTIGESIKEIESNINGSKLTFVSESGYHEYLAFNPENIKKNISEVTLIDNQNVHAMESPDMLVICPSDYLYAAHKLVSLHKKTDGLKLLVLTPEQVYNEFSSGKPDVSAFRKLLKMWYDRADGTAGLYPGYCLIMSRPTYDNKMVTTQVKNSGYPRIPIWQSPTGESESTSFSTDDYIGMLKDVNGDFNIATAEINVAVGRMPVKSLNEANLMIDKLEAYLLSEDSGSWRNNIMVIADDQDKGIHLEQAEKVIEKMKSQGKGKDAFYEKIYLDSYPLEYTGTGLSYPQAHHKMMNKWNEGTAFINYIGHANSKSWGHESLLTWSDINSMTNSRLPFIYAATCDFMRWDGDDISGAEALWLLPQSGVIGMICPSREVLISANGDLNYSSSNYLFQTDISGRNFSVGEIMRRGKNESNTGANKLKYGLLGDPSLRIPFPALTVKVDQINGIDIDKGNEMPELKARSKVDLMGHINDGEGSVISDFNGVMEINLYDAEKTITTNGNGPDGVESVYNERKTRLYSGRVKVIDGKWTANFTMPIEIENNFSPALLSLYAFEEKGREANGACENLYVYGFDTQTPDDFEGPKIIEFYLNRPDFISGSEVGPNPVLYIKFYDESGINVSESGIGHNLTLQLDSQTTFDDISRYYTPDEDGGEGGSIVYVLKNIDYGSHTLNFIVWDNANNSTSVSLDFKISALWRPSIETLTTDMNPATSTVNFIIETDSATSTMNCTIEVFDLSGRQVWKERAPQFNGMVPKTVLNWDLCDFGGAKLPGGLYLYRATVKTDNGIVVSKSNKLIVR